ncbi:DedA family protein [Patescibacteria group bacterium]|nr:DedA family protein [Patescibacteria group bacterium]MCL5114198.1 DedA family protein [Patescibacteria group bacterium]
MFALISNVVIETIKYLGYPGIFILMTLESVNIPIPSEVVMPFSGFLALQGNLDFWLVALMGTLGNLAGSFLNYFLAEWILGIREKYKVLRIILSERHLKKTDEWFKKYGSYSIFFGRVIPVVRTFISLPAGIGKMNIGKFTYLTFFGSFLWACFLTYVGFFLGNNWTLIQDYFRQMDYIILAAIAAALLYWLLRRRKRKKDSLH